MPEYYYKIVRMDLNMFDEEFHKVVASLYGDMVYNTLFGACGTLLSEGFHSLVKTIMLSQTMDKIEKKWS